MVVNFIGTRTFAIKVQGQHLNNLGKNHHLEPDSRTMQ